MHLYAYSFSIARHTNYAQIHICIQMRIAQICVYIYKYEYIK